MRVVSLSGLLITVLLANASASPCPTIKRMKQGYEVVLPVEFDKAIQATAPGFRPWELSDYDPDIRKYYRVTSRQTPWAVVGDFNGDGWCDVVIDGHDSTTAYRLCVWGGKKQSRVLRLTSGLLPTLPMGAVLQYVAPGEVVTNFDDSSKFLFNDGFNDYIWEKAGSLYFWNKDRFDTFTTSD